MAWLRTEAGERTQAVLAGLIAIAVLGVFSGFRATAMNNFVLLDVAWLHGHAWIHLPGQYIDALPYHGKAYVYEAPLPALLLFPAVAIWGEHTNQTILSILLAGIGIYAAWRVARQIGLGVAWTALFATFLLLGTSYAYCSATGDVWFLEHSGSVAFTLLAISECLGDRVPWRVVLWAFAAAFCRYPLFLAFPAYALALWPKIVEAPLRLVKVALVTALFAIPSAIYNYVRWGTPVDVGFEKFYRVMDIGSTDPSPPLDVKNLPMQLQFYFMNPPRYMATPPYLVVGTFGTALTFTSPALVVALFAPLRERAVQLLWLAALLCAIPAFTFYSTGMVQMGVRHALDFIPFLYALMAYAVRDRPWLRYSLPLFVWSIAFGVVELSIWEWWHQLVE